MRETELARLLERATDDLPGHVGAGAAWRRAEERRRRRRGGVVATVVGVAVVAVLVAPRLVGVERVSPPSPAPPGPSGAATRSLEPLTDVMVRPALDADIRYPAADGQRIPRSLQPVSPVAAPDAPALAVVQMTDGTVSYVDANGMWHTPSGLPEGELYPESLAGDGGAVALRSEAALEVYSLFSSRLTRYPVADVARTGLWANDSVGLFYDVPGPGGEVREHEGARLTDPVALPEGDDLANVAMDAGGNALHEFVDDEYVVWSNFQDVGIRRGTAGLGRLERPVAQAGVVAVVRSGADGSGPAAADGVLVIGADLAPRALLPVVGADPGDVVLHDFVAPGILLLEVEDRLLTWNHRSGDLREVATLPRGAVVSLADRDLGAP